MWIRPKSPSCPNRIFSGLFSNFNTFYRNDAFDAFKFFHHAIEMGDVLYVDLKGADGFEVFGRPDLSRLDVHSLLGEGLRHAMQKPRRVDTNDFNFSQPLGVGADVP